MSDGYISVRDWRRFQHYDPNKRIPPWIKNYVELLDDDDYLQLSSRHRALLHGIWLAYARGRCALTASPTRLGRILGWPMADGGLADGESMATGGLIDGESRANAGQKRGEAMVRTRDLKRLEQAGFIDIVASKELAEGYQGASPRARPRTRPEVETETEEPLRGLLSPSSSATREEGENSSNGRPAEDDEIYDQPPSCACFAPPPHDDGCPYENTGSTTSVEEIPF